jgi:nucleoid-associated protein YgaU
MRTKIALFILLLAALGSAVAAQTPMDDPHYARAVELREQAQAAYDAGDYDAAVELARQAKDELALYQGSIAPLPASYTVQLNPEDRDSLYKIAGYPFVYGDGELWYKLFQANRSTLLFPDDEDHIEPGEVIVIPSIAGEYREGEYNPSKRYPDFKSQVK